jgi:glutathione synthase/RimK-type ligase-like ATP-grasp enzyme
MWIYRKKGSKTGKDLGHILNCRSSYKYLPRHRNFIINYGQKCEYANLNANVEYNKVRVLDILREAEINVPKVYRKGITLSTESFPVLARKTYHSQGKDIIYIQTQEELNRLDTRRYDYLLEYIDKKSEYRVHFLRDYTTFVSVKINKDEQGDKIVRSHDNGWIQIEYNGQFKEALTQLARKVMDAVDYDFGAIDIIRKKDKFYVLEINTAPGLEDRKLDMYADYFKQKERDWRNHV